MPTELFKSKLPPRYNKKSQILRKKIELNVANKSPLQETTIKKNLNILLNYL